MAIYAIGDVQGCYDALRGLLDRLRFDPARDVAWFVGDLVNRGPSSLQVLRFVRSLADAAVCVLGNHDLHLLAMAAGNRARASKPHTMQAILDAHDRADLLTWLTNRPLMHHDVLQGFTLVHAGLAPQWTLPEALGYAREVEAMLTGPDSADLMLGLYGDEPSLWSDELSGIDRARFIVNCMTRMRFCDAKGRIDLSDSGPPEAQFNPRLLPWFAVPGRRTAEDRLVVGHWAALGYRAAYNVWSIDTGCVWGSRLTAIRIDGHSPIEPIAFECEGMGRQA